MIGIKNTAMKASLAVGIDLTMKLLGVFLFSLLLQGCATPFSKFYYDNTGGRDLTILPSVVLSTEEPQIYRGSDQEQDSLKMYEDSFNLVGYSSFNAGNVDEKGAIEQAKKIHASVILLYSKYTGTVSGYAPLTFPDTRTSTSTLNGNAYGVGGYASYSGTMQTTTQGTKTTYIPYSVDKSDYLASYWIKMKPKIFGVLVKDLTPQVRQQIGSNKGVQIFAVVKNSPAFEADIFNGDIVKQIGDDSIFDEDSFNKSSKKHAGKETDVIIFRGDKEIHKSVKLRVSLY